MVLFARHWSSWEQVQGHWNVGLWFKQMGSMFGDRRVLWALAINGKRDDVGTMKRSASPDETYGKPFANTCRKLFDDV